MPAARSTASPTLSPGSDSLQSIAEIRLGAPVAVDGRIVRVAVTIRGQDGARAGFELQWRYPPGILDALGPDAPLANLFTFTALIPILNYLPFCTEAIVEGPLEPDDAAWLNRAALEAAQEIKKQKLHPGNPYIRPEIFKNPESLRLSLPQIKSTASRIASPRLTPGNQRCAVLIEGIAEGLLTWAMLEELQAKPTAVFFDVPHHGLGASANAWAALSSQHPGQSVRIWTNLPLFYDFFLRHLDFLRPNYQTLQADTTPIRVLEFESAVFAALPVLWARGIGHFVAAHPAEAPERKGPSANYSMQLLFEQTRAFEDSVTRFFTRKGWGVQQWSPLRSASDIVIQRALGQRYPDLFPLQVACARPRLEPPPPPLPQRLNTPAPVSADEEAEEEETEDDGLDSSSMLLDEVEGLNSLSEMGGRREAGAGGRREAGAGGAGKSEIPRGKWRAVPCGACEACRRLVVILSALGYDPQALGYGPAKIERVLAHTSRVTSLPPEARVQRHVLYLLEKSRSAAKESWMKEFPAKDSIAKHSFGKDSFARDSSLPSEYKTPASRPSAPALPAAPSSPAAASASDPNPAAAPADFASGLRLDPCPEVEALRFDGARSFLDTIPVPLRRSIYQILLQYSAGAVRREGREWKPFDLLASPELDQPKRFRDQEFDTP